MMISTIIMKISKKYIIIGTILVSLLVSGFFIAKDKAPQVGGSDLWKFVSSQLQPVVSTWQVYAPDDLRFDDEILPDGDLCSDGQILKKTGADNWDCAADSAGGGVSSNSINFDEIQNPLVLDTNITTTSASFNWNWGATSFVNVGSVSFAKYIDLSVAGVRLNGDGDGAITFLGTGNGSDENFTINLDDVANEATISTTTGLTQFNFSGISVSSSLNFEAVGYASASKYFGIALTDCDSNGSQFLWSDTGLFSCQTLADADIPDTLTITNLSGTNTGDVTLAGTPDYITISNQVITRAKLDISDDTNATGGDGITITANDFDFVSTELEALTWGAGGNATNVWTHNLSAGDPTLTWTQSGASLSLNFEVIGYASGSKYFGATLTDCDSNGSQLLWSDTGLFSCQTLADADIPDTLTITNLSGTNTGDVTLAGTPDYITIVGQAITRAKLDISDDTNATGGAGVDITTNDFTFDSTEIEATTWGAGGNATNVWTHNLSSGDPTLTWTTSGASLSLNFEVLGYASASKYFGRALAGMAGTDGCSAAGDTLNYTFSTGAFSCGTDATGGGGVSSDSLNFDEFQNPLVLDTNITTTSASFNWDWGATSFINMGSASFAKYIDLSVAGVRLSGDGDGAITFLGTGNGSDENFTINLDDVANEATITSTTTLTQFNFSGIGVSTSLNFEAVGYASASRFFGKYASISNSLEIGTLAIGRLPLNIQADANSDIARFEENSGGEYFDIEVDSLGDLNFIQDDGAIALEIYDVSPDAAISTDPIGVNGIHGIGDANTAIDFDTDAFQFYAGGVQFVDFQQPAGQDVTVFNEDGVDIDFRVEGTGQANALFIDGANGNIGFKKVPTSNFDVSGTASVSSNFEASGYASASKYFGGIASHAFGGSIEPRTTDLGSLGTTALKWAQAVANKIHAVVQMLIPSGAGGSATGTVAGSIGVDSTSRSFNFGDGTNENVVDPRKCIGVSLRGNNLTAKSQFTIFTPDNPFTLSLVQVAASGTNSLGWNLTTGSTTVPVTNVFTLNKSASGSAVTKYTTFGNAVIGDGGKLDFRVSSASAKLDSVYVRACGYYDP